MSIPKTKFSHTLKIHNDNIGCDFLGFNIRQYVNKTKKHGFVTLIKPNQKAITKHYQRLAVIVKEHKGNSQANLIKALNQVIRGWCNYYRSVVSSRAFAKLDWLLNKKLYKWGLRRHGNKRIRWIVQKLFRPDLGRWRFSTPRGFTISFHTDCKITRHTKVAGTRSPYDGDELYWVSRLQRFQPHTLKGKILKRQKGKCAYCRLNLFAEDVIEMHHIDRNHENYKSENLALLHGHCHDQAHGSIKPSRLFHTEKQGGAV